MSETLGIWSLLPPLLAIVLAIVTRQVFISLFAGIVVGYCVVHDWHVLAGIIASLDALVEVFADAGNTRVILFSVLVGSLVALMQRSGGVDQGPVVSAQELPETRHGGMLRSLRVVVEEVRGKCTSGMQPGDFFLLHSGRLYIPAERHFCLYAVQAVLPMLPPKQRTLADDDWMKGADHVICPDPAGNVIMRIETL